MSKHLKPNIRIFNDTRGQAMTEFCVAMPVLIIMFWAIWYISDVYIVKHKTLVAARYGTWLLAKDKDLEKAKVDAFIAKRFFSNQSSKLTVTAQHLGTDAKTFKDKAEKKSGNRGGWIDKIIKFIAKTFMGSDSPTVYSLKVEYEVPLIFGALNISDFATENVKITSEHYVVGNTWNGCESEVHDIFDMIKSILGDLVDTITGGSDESYGTGPP